MINAVFLGRCLCSLPVATNAWRSMYKSMISPWRSMYITVNDLSMVIHVHYSQWSLHLRIKNNHYIILVSYEQSLHNPISGGVWKFPGGSGARTATKILSPPWIFNYLKFRSFMSWEKHDNWLELFSKGDIPTDFPPWGGRPLSFPGGRSPAGPNHDENCFNLL